MKQVKFAIVGDKHSGCRRLNDFLALHHEVKMFGEVFSRTNYQHMDWLDAQGSLIKVGEDPIQFLERIYSGDSSAVGIVLHHNHARDASWSPVWTYIRKNCRIIQLQPRNLLDHFLDVYADEGAIDVDPAEFHHFAEASRRDRHEAVTVFRHSARLELFEDEIELRIDDVYGFLDLPHHELPGEFDETQHVAQRDKIMNYEELKLYYSGKPYGEYFTS